MDECKSGIKRRRGVLKWLDTGDQQDGAFKETMNLTAKKASVESCPPFWPPRIVKWI